MSTIVVSNITELTQALASANGGETILLEEGNYGELSLTMQSGFDYSYPDTVTIASADPNKPAVFSAMDVRDAKNLTFDGIVFDYEFEVGDEIYYRPFSFSGNENLTIKNSVFDGDLAEGVSELSDGFGYAIGLSVRGGSEVVVENNEYFDFHRALSVSESSDIAVRNNEIHSIRMDGMNFSQIDGGLIEGNEIHNFKRSLDPLDHSDMIQFWTNGTDEPSRNIMIRDNILDIGLGDASQSIFMRNDQVDRGLAGDEMYYQNITITGNTIINGHRHGITVGETDGLTITSNTIVHRDGALADGTDSFVEIPRINVKEESRNVEISNNITYDISGWNGQPGWTVSQNAIVQDQDAAADGYYNDVFVSSGLTAINGRHSFVALPDGMLQDLTAGAPSTLTGETDNLIDVRFVVETFQTDASQRVFDAGVTASSLGPLPEGTRFEWSFGDGTSASGSVVSHSFDEGGVFDVSLTVTLPTGHTDQISVPVAIDGAGLLSYRLGQDMVASTAGNTVALTGAEMHDGLRLDETGIALTIDYEHVGRLLQTEEFAMRLKLQADAGTTGGEILRVHGSIIVAVDDDGEVVVKAYETDGREVQLKSVGANMDLGLEKTVEVALLNGRLAIKVDGVPLVSAPFEGTLGNLGGRDMLFGNAWGKTNFESVVSEFDILTNASDYALGATLYDELQPFVPLQVTPPLQETEQQDESSVQQEEAETLLPVPVVDAYIDMNLPDTIDLGGQGIRASVDRQDIDILPSADNFSIDVTLSEGSEGAWGEVFRLHGSFVVEVQEDGHLRVRVFSDEGELSRMFSEAPLFENNTAHLIQLGFEDDRLHLSIDGVENAVVRMTGNLGDVGRHDLVFGNPWGRQNFDGEVEAFSLTAETGEGLGETAINVTELAKLFEPAQDQDGMALPKAMDTSFIQSNTEAKAAAGQEMFGKMESDGLQSVTSLIDRFDQGGSGFDPVWNPSET